MKALKRFLVLALALVMSLSLFACGDNGGNGDNPGNGGDNPGNGGTEPEVNLERVEKDYVFDYQITDGKTISFDFEGAKPSEFIYVAGSDNEYEAYWSVNGSKIDVELEGTMVIADFDVSFYYTTDTHKYVYNLKMNPVTENYFVVDGTEESIKIETSALATNVKFNGAEIGAGITVAEDGITVDKSVLADKVGVHNKLEYVDNGVIYAVSVCAVTKKQMSSPIIFEDGKISPLMAIFGRDYKVVEGSEIEDAAVKAKYTGGYKYWNGTCGNWNPGPDDTTWVNNAYALEIDHKAGQTEMLKIFISTKYLQGRMEELKTLVDGSWDWPGDAGANGYNQFMTNEYNEEDATKNRAFTMRVIHTQTNNSQFYMNIAGEDTAIPGGTFGSIANVAQNARGTIDKRIYDKLIDAEGNILESYFAFYFNNAEESCKIYIDDIFAAMPTYSATFATLPIPGIV